MKISRLSSPKRFWHRALTALIVGLLLLAATARASLATNVAHHADATHGGTLSIRTEGPNDCLNTQLSTGNVTNQIAVALLDTLVTIDDKGRPSPDLATSWKVTNGGKVITFNLRHGVRFSNGDAFTASTVKWNFNHILNPATKAPLASLLGPLTAIRVLDPYTIQLVLKTAFRPLFTSLAAYYVAIIDPKVSTKLGPDKQCTYVVGTGPFKIQSVGPGFNPITLVRNPYRDWAPPWLSNQHQAYLDKLIFKPILSDTTAISSLLTGSVDISEVAAAQLGRIQHNSNIHVLRYVDEGEYALDYNLKRAPWNNADVRRAIAEAIDRKALVKAALDGLGTPAYSPLYPHLPFYDTQSQKYAARYDPADAERILKANHITGPFSMVLSNEPTTTATGELIQAELQQVGLTVNAEPHSSQDASAIRASGNYDLSIGYASGNDPDSLYLTWAPGNPRALFSDPRLTKDLVVGRTSTDPKVARKAYVDAQRFINNLTLTDPLFTPLNLFGINKRVHGWKPNFFSLGYTVEPMVQDLWVSK
jgi:peptide/nickel transport system substrate-binding protein